MKKAIVMLLLLFLLPALTACQNGSVLPAQSLSTNVPGTSPVMPEALEADMRTDSRVSALFFRFGDEPFLASEYRVIQHTATQSYETALIQALLSGPAANSPLLQGLFPENTRVLATSTTGRTPDTSCAFRQCPDHFMTVPYHPAPCASSRTSSWTMRRMMCWWNPCHARMRTCSQRTGPCSGS